MIELVELDDKTAVNFAFEKLDEIDWLVFTSENAVNFFFQYAKEAGIKFYFYPNLKIATVGEKTKLKLEQLGYRTNFVPIGYTAEVLAENMDEDISGKKVLIPRSDLANDEYLKVFEERGAEVYPLTVYKNQAIEYSKETLSEKLTENIDYLTFTSGSTIQSFYRSTLNADLNLSKYKIYCIGPSTARAAQNLGYVVDGVANPHTEEAMFDLILKDN
jgi:uroporphyrinogen III methyltransferase/synthase